jgi:hypothetical protein
MEPVAQQSGFSKRFVENLTCLLVAEIMPLGLSGSSGFSGQSGLFRLFRRSGSTKYTRQTKQTIQMNKKGAVKEIGHDD